MTRLKEHEEKIDIWKKKASRKIEKEIEREREIKRTQEKKKLEGVRRKKTNKAKEPAICNRRASVQKLVRKNHFSA